MGAAEETSWQTKVFPGKIKGASPSEDKYYVLMLFDISDDKKYRLLVKILKKYGMRIQKSVFEGQMRSAQIKEMLGSLERLMSSERYKNPDDKVRVYKIAGNCEMSAFGEYVSNILEEDMFF